MRNVKIYLSSWQRRLINDFLGKTASILEISLALDTVSAYKSPLATNELEKYILLYLTDEQMCMIQDKFEIKHPCHFIELGQDSPIKFI